MKFGEWGNKKKHNERENIIQSLSEKYKDVIEEIFKFHDEEYINANREYVVKAAVMESGDPEDVKRLYECGLLGLSHVEMLAKRGDCQEILKLVLNRSFEKDGDKSVREKFYKEAQSLAFGQDVKVVNNFFKAVSDLGRVDALDLPTYCEEMDYNLNARRMITSTPIEAGKFISDQFKKDPVWTMSALGVDCLVSAYSPEEFTPEVQHSLIEYHKEYCEKIIDCVQNRNQPEHARTSLGRIVKEVLYKYKEKGTEEALIEALEQELIYEADNFQGLIDKKVQKHQEWKENNERNSDGYNSLMRRFGRSNNDGRGTK